MIEINREEKLKKKLHFTFFFSCVTLCKELPTRAELFQFYSYKTFIFALNVM